MHLVGLNNMYDYDYDIESLKADIESLSGSLSRLEYAIQETTSLSEHYNY